jgi:hypothetical protein
MRLLYVAILAVGLAGACGGSDEPEDTTPASNDNDGFKAGAGAEIDVDDDGVEADVGGEVKAGDVGVEAEAGAEVGEDGAGVSGEVEAGETDEKKPDPE